MPLLRRSLPQQVVKTLPGKTSLSSDLTDGDSRRLRFNGEAA